MWGRTSVPQTACGSAERRCAGHLPRWPSGSPCLLPSRRTFPCMRGTYLSHLQVENPSAYPRPRLPTRSLAGRDVMWELLTCPKCPMALCHLGMDFFTLSPLLSSSVLPHVMGAQSKGTAFTTKHFPLEMVSCLCPQLTFVSDRILAAELSPPLLRFPLSRPGLGPWGRACWRGPPAPPVPL